MKKRVVNDKLPGRYGQMDSAELEKEVSQFDKEFLGDYPSLSQEARAQHALAKRKRGRPKNGRGAKIISISLESRLLRQTDSLAKRHRMSRSQVIALGLRKVLMEWRKAS